MAERNINYASFGKMPDGGAIFVAPTGTALPDDATSAIDSNFKSLGIVGSDGFKESKEGKENTIEDINGDTVLKMTHGVTKSWTFTLLHVLDVDVLKQVYGDSNVSGTYPNIKIDGETENLPIQSWVVETILTDGVIERMIIPKGQITKVEKSDIKGGEGRGFAVTLTAYTAGKGSGIRIRYAKPEE